MTKKEVLEKIALSPSAIAKPLAPLVKNPFTRFFNGGRINTYLNQATKSGYDAKKIMNKAKGFHPIRKTVGTAIGVGAAAAAMGTAGKLLETQSNQVQYGNQDPNKVRNV